jgi:hypothetical protein
MTFRSPRGMMEEIWLTLNWKARAALYSNMLRISNESSRFHALTSEYTKKDTQWTSRTKSTQTQSKDQH